MHKAHALERRRRASMIATHNKRDHFSFWTCLLEPVSCSAFAFQVLVLGSLSASCHAKPVIKNTLAKKPLWHSLQLFAKPFGFLLAFSTHLARLATHDSEAPSCTKRSDGPGAVFGRDRAPTKASVHWHGMGLSFRKIPKQSRHNTAQKRLSSEFSPIAVPNETQQRTARLGRGQLRAHHVVAPGRSCKLGFAPS